MSLSCLEFSSCVPWLPCWPPDSLLWPARRTLTLLPTPVPSWSWPHLESTCSPGTASRRPSRPFKLSSSCGASCPLCLGCPPLCLHRRLLYVIRAPLQRPLPTEYFLLDTHLCIDLSKLTSGFAFCSLNVILSEHLSFYYTLLFYVSSHQHIDSYVSHHA